MNVMELYEVVRNAVSPETIDLVKNALIISKDSAYYVDGVPLSDTKRFGDKQCPDSYVFYGHPVCEALLLSVQPICERVSGKRLVPTYSYSRIYWKNAILEKHKDRPSCQYSVTLCIDVDPEPWPIYMGGSEIILQPGDLACYKGMDIEHWRTPYAGRQQIQVFLHYVDKDDIHAEWAFDKRPLLGFDKKITAEKIQEKFRKAVALHRQGKFDEARTLHEEILRVEPKHSEALHLLGVIANQTGNPQKAVELIDQAIEISPNNAAFYSSRGVALQALDKLDAALASFDRAIEIKPDYADVYFSRGNVLKVLKQFDAAMDSYNKAIALNPDYAQVYAEREAALKNAR